MQAGAPFGVKIHNFGSTDFVAKCCPTFHSASQYLRTQAFKSATKSADPKLCILTPNGAPACIGVTKCHDKFWKASCCSNEKVH